LVRLPERWRKRSEPDPPSAGEGRRVYCVGDIHGRLDLLANLHAQILDDSSAFDGDRFLVYLGDYIDRGGQSRQVIDLLLHAPLEGFEPVFLRGNHEQALLDWLEHPEAAAAWLGFGGRETLASYGIDLPGPVSVSDLHDAMVRLGEVLPDTHRSFLENTTLSWRSGDYYFVHAGIRPGVALRAQHPEDQLWIREEFTGSTQDHGVVVVHGHTISQEPELLPNRIGLDTGAFHTGVLTCLVLDGAHKRLLQTGRGSP
jgi:serine/threonine protein phosphatase 1